MTSVQSPTEQLYREALKYIPGGTSRLHYYYTPFPIYARSGGGCRLICHAPSHTLDAAGQMHIPWAAEPRAPDRQHDGADHRPRASHVARLLADAPAARSGHS